MFATDSSTTRRPAVDRESNIDNDLANELELKSDSDLIVFRVNFDPSSRGSSIERSTEF